MYKNGSNTSLYEDLVQLQIPEEDHFEGITIQWDRRRHRLKNSRGESCMIRSYGKTALAINNVTKTTKHFGK